MIAGGGHAGSKAAIMRLARWLAAGGMSRQVKSLILCVGFTVREELQGDDQTTCWPSSQ